MDWLKITIDTNAEAQEALCGLLMACGAAGFELENGAEIKNFVQHKTDAWDYVGDGVLAQEEQTPRIKFYLPNNEQGQAQYEDIQALLNNLRTTESAFYGALTVTACTAHDEDWADNWRQYYKPIHLEGGLVIVPSWEDYQADKAEVVVRLDPGMAFGTGDHATTMLALRLLMRYMQPGMKVLDVGTGSGIIAIAAAKLGASSVLATDYDQMSVKISDENIAKNGVQNIVSAKQADLLHGVTESYNLLCANIVADILLRLLPDVAAHLNDDGICILSGIISNRFGEILHSLPAAGLQPLVKLVQDDWIALAVSKEKSNA